jgi:hypothetical protein
LVALFENWEVWHRPEVIESFDPLTPAGAIICNQVRTRRRKKDSRVMGYLGFDLVAWQRKMYVLFELTN